METRRDFADAIGHTPLIRLHHASDLTGCEMLGKAEFANPGGSIKDRTALGLLLDGERRGLLRPGGIIVECTAGNTGIGLALLGASRGYRTVITMPATQSREKIDALRVTGAEVHLVPAVPYENPGHYAHVARRMAEEMNARDAGSAWFANQFDNTANRDFHEVTTGIEIFEQTSGQIDGFVCASGTGGTIAGVARALKARKPAVTIALADPAGSALANYVNHGELAVEGNSISEGIGSSRVAANFEGAPIDLAWSIPDEESLTGALPACRGGVQPRRFQWRQRGGCDPPRARARTRARRRHHPLRFGHALSGEAVQSRISALEGIARARLAPPCFSGHMNSPCASVVTPCHCRSVRWSFSESAPTAGGKWELYVSASSPRGSLMRSVSVPSARRCRGRR